MGVVALPTKEQVTEALKGVIDPELRRSIVELGMVRSVQIADDGQVDVVVSLTTPGCPIRSHFQNAVAERVGELEGVTRVGVGFDVLSNEEKGRIQQTLGRQRLPEGALAQVKNVVCVASGKGGVGKSTMTANLAAALHVEGQTSGALDCDVYGYSIPRMLGVNSKPEVNAERKIVPLTAPSGVKVMSIGFFLDENAAVVWRGPMLHKAIQQFLEDVDWGELDYLIVDLPPGTGDAPLSLAQLVPMSGAVIVTTPQDVALQDVSKGMGMFRKLEVPIIGVIENMSYFVCDHCQTRHEIFGRGGGERIARHFGVPFLGQVPLQPAVREGGDEGRPIVVTQPRSAAAEAFRAVAGAVAQQVSILAYSNNGAFIPINAITLNR